MADFNRNRAAQVKLCVDDRWTTAMTDCVEPTREGHGVPACAERHLTNEQQERWFDVVQTQYDAAHRRE